MAVKFEIYRGGERLTQFQPMAVMAIGPESVPMASDISVRDGLLIIERGDDHAMGVSLLWDVGPLGAFHLETTRLAQRDKPYNLNVELARFRLMKIVQKQEDWNLFDFPRSEKYIQSFREAQALFAEALGLLESPGQAARLADQALAMAVDLSEQLAAFHAELLLNRRRQSTQFAKHIFGCRINPSASGQKYKDALASHFDYAVLPMSWRQVQPEEQNFQTQPIDEWMEFLSKKRMPVIAGPLINLVESDVPDWMFIWEHDFDTIRELAYEYVQKIVNRYRKVVSAWNVCAGVYTGSAFTLSFEQAIELTRLLVSQVKTMLPAARTLVTINYPFGEFHAQSRASVPPLLYAEMVSQAGINFDGFGLELELGVPRPGMFMRDLFQISVLLDRFSTLGRPLFLTSVSAPGQAGPDTGDATGGQLDPNFAGRWHRPWDQHLQKEWLEAVYELALSKPYVESIAWGNLADVRPTMPAGGLLDANLKPKPAMDYLQSIRTKYQRKA